MKRFFMTAFLVWLFFLLQTSVCPWFSFGGIVPNLLIILTVSFGIMRGEITGLWVGFACGILVDLFAATGTTAGDGNLLGFFGLLYLLIGYVNGKFNRLFYPEEIKLPLFLIMASDVSLNIICYACLFLLRARLDFGNYFLHIILPEMIYTILIAFAFYPLLLWINRKLEAGERGSND